MTVIDWGVFRIHTGGGREVMRGMAENSIDSIVTDPPYDLTSARPGGRSEATRGAVMRGFMGLKWDGSGVAFEPETWREALRVLKPGGHLLAFGGTRTYHRMVCAIEDAGFEIRDQIGWAYGSGFPKSHNGEWGGTALKPAWEPICMARKPLIGTVEANWREWGTGALNIDGCRVGDEVRFNAAANNKPGGNILMLSAVGMPQDAEGRTAVGRWPANLIHDGSDEVLESFPQAPGQLATESFTAPSSKTRNVFGAMRRGNGRDGEPSADDDNEGAVGFKMRPGARRLDSGSAARFFYCSKASRADRNEGLAGMPERVLSVWGGDEDDLSAGKKATRPTANHHPTVKPTDLMRYLCRLVTPPGGLVLDPFAGSGSTGKAAMLEGFRFIGIDLTPEYVALAERRIATAIFGALA